MRDGRRDRVREGGGKGRGGWEGQEVVGLMVECSLPQDQATGRGW